MKWFRLYGLLSLEFWHEVTQTALFTFARTLAGSDTDCTVCFHQNFGMEWFRLYGLLSLELWHGVTQTVRFTFTRTLTWSDTDCTVYFHYNFGMKWQRFCCLLSPELWHGVTQTVLFAFTRTLTWSDTDCTVYFEWNYAVKWRCTVYVSVDSQYGITLYSLTSSVPWKDIVLFTPQQNYGIWHCFVYSNWDCAMIRQYCLLPVSYTHLTLPTIRRV